jgi:hypothetical protein
MQKSRTAYVSGNFPETCVFLSGKENIYIDALFLRGRISSAGGFAACLQARDG